VGLRIEVVKVEHLASTLRGGQQYLGLILLKHPLVAIPGIQIKHLRKLVHTIPLPIETLKPIIDLNTHLLSL
jgi:hypothetical protein